MDCSTCCNNQLAGLHQGEYFAEIPAVIGVTNTLKGITPVSFPRSRRASSRRRQRSGLREPDLVSGRCSGWPVAQRRQHCKPRRRAGSTGRHTSLRLTDPNSYSTQPASERYAPDCQHNCTWQGVPASPLCKSQPGVASKGLHRCPSLQVCVESEDPSGPLKWGFEFWP